MTRRLAPAAAASLTAATLAVAASAVSRLVASAPVFWTVATQSDFLKGEVEHVTVDSDGRVSLGPFIDVLADPAVPVLWTVADAPGGAVYLAGGHDGRVFRATADGRVSVVFDADEMDVHALAVAPDGGVFVGTSPDGKVYRLRPDGTSSVWFDPDEKYIWALAVDAAGVMYVGTGERGRIYRVGPDGRGALFYETRSTNVVAVAFDREGRLLAGTESPGRVFRIDRDGRGFVLLDAPYREVRALRLDEAGTLYVAALGARAPERPAEAGPPSEAARPGAQTPVVTVSTEVLGVALAEPAASRPPGAERREAAAASQGAVYRIMPDGVWELRWESAEDLPYDLFVDPRGNLLIGTGSGGKIFRVSGEPATVTLLGRADAQQITRWLPDREGHLRFVTSNPGKLFRLTRDRSRRGTYLSEVRDAQTVAAWGTIRWRATGGGRVELSTRSGNTATPDATWSDWSAPYAHAGGSPIASPKARYLQWRAVLTAPERGGDDPVLTSVTVAFLPRNLRPQVTAITIHPPGTIFQRPFPTSDQIEIAGLEVTPVDGRPGQAPPPGGAPGGPPVGRRLYQKGFQTITWSARDGNDDTLQYDVLYRREGDTAWRALKRGLWDPILVWDTTSVPDGTYSVKVVASDAPTNSPATALAGEAESDVFDIDNTPPRIEVGAWRPTADATVLSFTVRDEQSAVRRVEYSVDADRWRLIYPIDGIADSPVETFELVFDAAGQRVIIRATDVLNNVATVAVAR